MFFPLFCGFAIYLFAFPSDGIIGECLANRNANYKRFYCQVYINTYVNTVLVSVLVHNIVDKNVFSFCYK